MSYHIGITLREHAYTPEAYAYERFLSKAGWKVTLAKEEDIPLTVDIAILFMGIKPCWTKKRFRKEIHEFHSLSVPPFAKFKDFLKSNISYVPDGRIFLNEAVQKRLSFRDNKPFLLRDMGVDESLFKPSNPDSRYDIIYCGSIENRSGLVESLCDLAKLGFSLLVVGGCSTETQCKLSNFTNIEYVGKVGREALPALYAQARYGLNYTPDLYPFNIQTSTKTLEYLAAGLGVISNKYQWIEEFAERNNFTPIWLENVREHQISILHSSSLSPDIMSNYSWDNILEENNFERWLSDLIKM